MNQKLWNKKTKQLIPYTPGEQPRTPFIKLNTNENPYPPSPLAIQALREFDPTILRKYPDPSSTALKKTMAGYYDVKPENLFLGNGSDEVLAIAFQAFFDKEMPVAFPDITYSFYPVYTRMYEIPSFLVPLRDDFTLGTEDYYDFKGGVVLANPNAPTGIGVSKAKIEALLQSNRNRLVIVDEAYIDFGGESCVDLIQEYDHLLVIQTLSKSRSLAGLRVGYAIGDPSLIKALECVRDSFNSYTMDTIAMAVAGKSFEDGEWFEKTRAKIITAREFLVLHLTELGFKVLPSVANFVFVSHQDVSAVHLYELLRKKGILVRYFNINRIDRFLRITIGTMADMEQLIRTVQDIMNEEPMI